MTTFPKTTFPKLTIVIPAKNESRLYSRLLEVVVPAGLFPDKVYQGFPG